MIHGEIAKLRGEISAVKSDQSPLESTRVRPREDNQTSFSQPPIGAMLRDIHDDIQVRYLRSK